MKSTIRIAGVALAVFAALPAQADLFWHTSYEAAVEEAERTGKPIFLQFRCAP